MEDKIEALVEQHKLAKQECWEQINQLQEKRTKNLSRINNIKILEKEYDMRSIFINELENLI